VRELVPHTIVLLRTAADSPDLPGERLEELQEGHLAFLDEQRAHGRMLAGGPFRDRVDENLRGLCVYALPLEEVRAIVLDDPYVRAGVMDAQVFTWLIPPGQARFGPH
jgi:uncharacterized protein YciI